MGPADAENPVKRLRHTPLYDAAQQRSAHFTTFAGWSMPLSFTSIVDEHMHVRTHAGVFDVSHMGRLQLEGDGALPTIQRLVSSDLSKLAADGARYTLLLTPWGGILDDLLVYRTPTGLLLVVNAANTDGDRDWIRQNLAPDTTLTDLTGRTALLALQGPDSEAVLSSLTTWRLSALRRFASAHTEILGSLATIMRTGYAGEDGFEILVAAADAPALWEAILATRGAAPEAAPAVPCGLGARDTLRMEAGLLLHGQDISRTTSPFEAGLERFVALDRPDFVGRDALLEERRTGPKQVLVGLSTWEHAIPRHGDTIASAMETVGHVTSGSYSPVLRHPIALGYVAPAFAAVGGNLTVVSHDRRIPVSVVERPFYRRGVTPLLPNAPAATSPTYAAGP
jgi:aminomethyltransferase